MDKWAGFFGASAGVSATLTGMLIVAISINLSRILAVARLPERAAGALIPLAGVLTFALLGLVPDQPLALFGGEVLSVAALVWILDGLMILRSRPGEASAGAPPLWPRVVLAQAQTLPFMIGGVMMASGAAAGLSWMAPGVIIALLVGVLNTWVLLVEILR